MLYSWQCPYCNSFSTISDSDTSFIRGPFQIENKRGRKYIVCEFIVCPNIVCKELSLNVYLYTLKTQKYEDVPDMLENKWSLFPQSNAKVLPDYVPHQIVNDYNEACSIASLSPKASATLSRRCLQGMIRDFWKIKRRTLYKEIEAIKGKVEQTTWKAIDGVRKMGNIGAHMNKNTDLIIDIDPSEAMKLIKLIEILIKDWYIYRHEREESMESIIDISNSKEQIRKNIVEKVNELSGNTK